MLNSNTMDKSNRKATRGLLLLVIALAVIGLDQLTKYLIRANMELGESIPGTGPFRLTYTTNSGGAFGIFTNQAFLLAIVAVIVLIVTAVERLLKVIRRKRLAQVPVNASQPGRKE